MNSLTRVAVSGAPKYSVTHFLQRFKRDVILTSTESYNVNGRGMKHNGFYSATIAITQRANLYTKKPNVSPFFMGTCTRGVFEI